MPHSPVQHFYCYQAGLYDLTRWVFLYGRQRAIARLGLRPDSTVLEIGCGTGLNFKPILGHLDPGRGRLMGLDFSEHMLRRAARRVASCGYRNVTLMHADAERLSLDERFDGVLFAYSLSMIPDWQAALERAHEHLRPGGRLVVLDFGRFDGWGRPGRAVRAWLRMNHVETSRPYATTLEGLFDNPQFESHLGGYYFIAAGENATRSA